MFVAKTCAGVRDGRLTADSDLDYSFEYDRDKTDNSGLLEYIPTESVKLVPGNASGSIMSPEWVDSLIMVELRTEVASIGGALQDSYDLIDFYASVGVNGIWLTPVYEKGENGNGYVNGSMGIITSIDTVDETICVHLDNDTEVEITKEKWEKMKYKQVDDSLEGISCGYIIQYPLRLGYAITVHKSQGMTLDNIFVDISRAFEIGQIYTALSRCRSIDGLYLKSVPKEDMVLLSDKISDFIEKVDENEGVLNPEKISDIGKDMIKKQQDLFNFEEFGL